MHPRFYQKALDAWSYSALVRRVYGHRAALCAFNVDGIHANDLCTLLDQAGIACRSGHHCTQPLHRYLGVPGTARASLYFYNTPADVDAFIDALRSTIDFFSEFEE